ncbi:MAG: hypothetical protein FWC40_09845, partial [Proteobacteria bacterium]|nr:hypothetical protein [Pseudomonadota bacterium]
PNQRVKNLARLVRVIRNIGGAELEGHSMYSEEAAHLASMKCMGYQPIIPFGVILLTTLPVIVFLSVYLFVHLEKLTLYSDIFHSGDIFRLFSIVGAIMLFFLKKYFFGKALEKSYEMNSEVEQFHEVGEAQHRKVMEHYGVRESTFCEEQTAWELFKNL